MRTLVVGDPHTEIGDDLRRFDILGQFIIDYLPDNVILMGDFLSLDTISHWNASKPGLVEGKRLREEIDIGKEGIYKIMSPLISLQEKQRQQKKAIYRPDLTYLFGNHEDRYDLYCQANPVMEGLIDLRDLLGLDEYGWSVIPYRQYQYVGGIAFTHVAMDGANRPLGGERAHVNHAKDHSQTVVYGHTHLLNVTSIARHGNPDDQIFAINCGCFLEEIPQYAKGSKGSKNWWKGLLMLDHYEYGKVDITTYSMRELINGYGNS